MLPGLVKGRGRDRRVANSKAALREKAARLLGRCIESLEERRLLSAPSITAISDTQVWNGRSLIVPITASDDDGSRLTYTVTSSN
ncbi:MAG: hypothetical protein ACM359_24645, partial [Bacillota bacterium]